MRWKQARGDFLHLGHAYECMKYKIKMEQDFEKIIADFKRSDLTKTTNRSQYLEN